MKAITGQELGRELCTMFGLDANKVRSINVACNIDDAALVTVEMYVDELGELEVRTYKLVDTERETC